MAESRTIFSLASILSFRMLGLFMIYPVFAIYAPSFSHANATLIGIALGIYGLTQALLQLPLSLWSDRIGRRPIITGGLLVFALGSIVAAITHNIYLLIAGRALQGAGAIGSTLMAFTADLTSVENRTKAMAFMGMTIGLSFGIAMIIGPVINSWFHLSGIFWLTALFALAGIAIQHFLLPHSHKISLYHQPTHPVKEVIKLLLQKDLLQFNLSVLVLHALFTASFMVLPLLFSNLGFQTDVQWKIYLPTLIGAFIISLPILIFSEKKKVVKQSFLLSVGLIALSEFLFYRYPLIKITIIIGLFIFFTGFTLLEAFLPSLISKIAPVDQKGSAMGIYSTFQFFGIFLGGALGGLLRTYQGNETLFHYCFVICILWLIYTFYMKSERLYHF